MKTLLPKNMNTLDRVLRFTIAAILLGYSYFNQSWIAFILGLFIVFEASFSWCIVYQILGKNNCSCKKKGK